MDMNPLVGLQKRGLLAQSVHPQELGEHFLSSQRSVYFGIDPTAESMHVGHLVLIRAALHLQSLGHRIVVVLGGATSLIGDPSGKTKMRSMMSHKTIADHLVSLKKQMSQYIDVQDPQKGMFVDNAQWLMDLKYLEFIRDIGKHFSVNRMLTAECFKQRLHEGLSFLEFNYMLLQSYDFYHLFENHGVSVQIGGDDQWSHMLSGVDLVRRISRHQVYALTVPLLISSSGKKMGKTEDGVVWLDPEKTSPLSFFQYWRNLDDADVLPCMRMLTDVDDNYWTQRLTDTNHVQDWSEAKNVLAYEITAFVHGKDEAVKVRDVVTALFQKGSSAVAAAHFSMQDPAQVSSCVKDTAEDDNSSKSTGDLLSNDALKKAMDPTWISWQNEESSTDPQKPLQDIMVLADVVSSKKEARRLFEQGGIQLEGKVCKDPYLAVKRSVLCAEGLWLKKGKKSFYLLKCK